MDISTLDTEVIEKLAFCWSVSQWGYLSAHSTDNKKRLRKKMTKDLDKTYNIDSDIMAHLKNCDDGEFFDILESCSAYTEKIAKDKKQAFTEKFSELSEDATELLYDFAAGFYETCTKNSNGDMIFYFPKAYAVGTVLTLKNSVVKPSGFEFPKEEITDTELEKTDDGYILRLFYVPHRYDDFTEVIATEEEKEELATITFTDAQTELGIYKSNFKGYDPWTFLSEICSSLVELSEHKELTDKEKALLPQAKELSFLFGPNFGEYKVTNFPIFKSKAQASGYKKVLKLVDKIEAQENDSDRLKQNIKLRVELQNAKYEQLWRTLYAPFEELQNEYPEFISLFDTPKILPDVRSTIQTFMEEHGYEGEYPNFVKTATVSGVHIIGNMIDGSVLVGRDNAVFYVQCHEYIYDNDLSVSFFCGTQILKKGEKVGDIFTSTFKSPRRTAEDGAYFNTDSDDMDKVETLNRLKRILNIAVKKTELKKLNKYEKKSAGLESPSFLASFVFLSIIGILYCVMLMGGFLLIGGIIGGLTLGFDGIREIIEDMPWLKVGALAYALWEVFAVIFSII